MRNQYPGPCVECAKRVQKGEGYFERRGGRWAVRCMKCVATGKSQKGKPLSHAQEEFLRNRESSS